MLFLYAFVNGNVKMPPQGANSDHRLHPLEIADHPVSCKLR